MLTHSKLVVETMQDAVVNLEGLLNEGITENSNKNYAEAHDLLKLAYDYSKEHQQKVSDLIEAAISEDEKQQNLELKRSFTQVRMDAAYFLGANYLAQKAYKKAERLFHEAWLYASLTLQDEGITAAATLYRGICFSRLYQDDVLINDAATVYNAKELLTSAIRQLENLVKGGRESYKHQLGLAYLHLISFSQGAILEGYREYLNSAITIFQELNNDEELALAYHQSGLMYTRLRADKAALAEFKKAQCGLEALGLNKELVFTLQQIEFCRMRLGKISPMTALENSRKQFDEQLQSGSDLDAHEKALFIANKISYEVSLIQGDELSEKEALQSFEETLKSLPGESVQELTYFIEDTMITSKSSEFFAIGKKFLAKAKDEAAKRNLSAISAPTVLDRMTTAATVLRALSMPNPSTGLLTSAKDDKVVGIHKSKSALTMEEALIEVRRNAETNFSPFAPFFVNTLRTENGEAKEKRTAAIQKEKKKNEQIIAGPALVAKHKKGKSTF